MADFLKVEEILNQLGFEDDMVVAEFGCGAAHFTIAIANKVKKGRVYAIDVLEEKLSALKSKLALEKINNVSTILADLESINGSTLPDNAVDMVLIPNVLFQAEDKNSMLSEASRILKSKGQLLIVDWLKSISSVPKSSLVDPEEIKATMNSLGLSCKKEFHAGDYHFALLFVK